MGRKHSDDRPQRHADLDPAGSEWRRLNTFGDSLSSVAIGNFTGDARADLLRWTGSGFEVSNGAVDAWTAFWTPTSGSYPISSLGFADFTGDGVTDIFLSGQP